MVVGKGAFTFFLSFFPQRFYFILFIYVEHVSRGGTEGEG